MPAIDPEYLTGVAFLYRTVEEAKAHARIGGTALPFGMIVQPGDTKETTFYALYLVSNAHVVFGASACVARLNRKDGGPPDIFNIDQNAWISVPGHDLAIAPFGDARSESGVLPSRDLHDFIFCGENQVLTKEQIEAHQIDIGDEVFMIGRFMNMQGKDRNQSAARFGSISMMLESLRNRYLRADQLGYSVEMRSRTGFSGSPVFTYGNAFTTIKPRKLPNFFGLLGINWGYVNDPDADPGEENTWLNGVVPGWAILDAFKTVPKLVTMQAMATEQFKAEQAQNAGEASLTGAAKSAPPSKEVPDSDKDRFTALLDGAVGKPKQGG